MNLLDRDRQIVLSVARFGQLAAGQIHALHFDGLTQTPTDRALKRLVELRMLARIERRMVGGTGAGSGQYVYQLGSMGWVLAGKAGRYYPQRAVNHHTLAIVDAYLELLQVERTGLIEIRGFFTEPDSWRTIEGIELRPDLFIEVLDVYRGRTLHLWLEIDMGTERPKKITDKLAAYWYAYQHSSEAAMPQSSAVFFLAPDDDRAKTLSWIIEQGDEDAQKLFAAFTISSFASLLFR